MNIKIFYIINIQTLNFHILSLPELVIPETVDRNEEVPRQKGSHAEKEENEINLLVIVLRRRRSSVFDLIFDQRRRFVDGRRIVSTQDGVEIFLRRHLVCAWFIPRLYELKVL